MKKNEVNELFASTVQIGRIIKGHDSRENNFYSTTVEVTMDKDQMFKIYFALKFMALPSGRSGRLIWDIVFPKNVLTKEQKEANAKPTNIIWVSEELSYRIYRLFENRILEQFGEMKIKDDY